MRWPAKAGWIPHSGPGRKPSPGVCAAAKYRWRPWSPKASNACAWALPGRTSATPSPWACPSRFPAASSNWTRRLKRNVSGPALSTVRPASWFSARDRWYAPVMAAPGTCWPNTRPTITACSIRSAACAVRRKCCCCAKASVAGAFMITFAAMWMRRYASRN